MKTINGSEIEESGMPYCVKPGTSKYLGKYAKCTEEDTCLVKHCYFRDVKKEKVEKRDIGMGELLEKCDMSVKKEKVDDSKELKDIEREYKEMKAGKVYEKHRWN